MKVAAFTLVELILDGDSVLDTDGIQVILTSAVAKRG